MRIAIVTEYYRPWPGGISEHVHFEAQELRRRGHEVLIVTGPAAPGWDEDDGDVMRLGFELKFTHNGALSRMVLGDYLLRFRRLLRARSLDVVHVHAPMDPFLGMAALVASECTTVGTFHANFEPSSLWDTLYQRLRPITGPIWRRMHGRIAVSPEARRSIAHYFPGEYEIIPNGVDTERFHPDVKALAPFDDQRPTILFVGRADPRKGLPLLLRAFADVHRTVEGARLVVVGVRAEEVEAETAALPAEVARNVSFEGYVAPETMANYFAGCDVFCSPATGQESQGIVLLEAMAAGRPPVAFAIPGYRDVIEDDVDGVLVESVGAEALADSLRAVLLDRERLTRLAEAGRRSALRYSWPSVAERIEAHFERACETRARAAGDVSAGAN